MVFAILGALNAMLTYDIVNLRYYQIMVDLLRHTPPWVEKFSYVEYVYLGIKTGRLTWGIIMLCSFHAAVTEGHPPSG